MSRRSRIRVLVIDDSAFSRRTIIGMLERSPLVEVADWAPDGQEALAKALANAYDLITLDLEMPRMDGFTFLRILMARRPTPVIVVSSRGDNQDVFKALELGAVDFVAKPTPRATPELATIEQELIRKVHAVRELRLDHVVRPAAAPEPLPPRDPLRPHRVVAIGCSTGGPAALMRLFSDFRTPPPCAFVVSQHMPAGFTASFARRLDTTTVFRAREAEDGMPVEEGMIMVAPGGAHLEFDAQRAGVVARLVPRKPSERYAPSVDCMFRSAAKHWGPDLLGVVLTGMGDDGAAGAVELKRSGGNVIVESADTAVIFGMPQQAIRAGAVDAVVPLQAIAPLIESGFAGRQRPDARGAG
jgi:two-component system, chemotaxis family, protein-glutamate methylesterase/glutaminase